MVATRVRAEASAKINSHLPFPSVVSACGGTRPRHLPRDNGAAAPPLACLHAPVHPPQLSSGEGHGQGPVQPLPHARQRGAVTPLLLHPGAGRQRQSQGGLAAPAQPLPVTAPGRMRPAATTMRYLESLKCLLNDKRGTNSCANSFIKVSETLQGAAPLVPALGSPEAAGQPGLKSLWFFAIKLLSYVWGSCGRQKVQRDRSQHTHDHRHRRLRRVWRCPRRAVRPAQQAGSPWSCPASLLRRLGSRPGSFPTQIHPRQARAVDGASLDPHQGGCRVEGTRTWRDIPEDRAREQHSTRRQGHAISIPRASCHLLVIGHKATALRFSAGFRLALRDTMDPVRGWGSAERCQH